MSEFKPLKHQGYVWALYIDTNFIEYFNTYASAKKFATKFYDMSKVFIKPVSYFTYNGEQQT